MKYFFTKYRFFLSGAALILTAASCTDTLGGDPDTDARAITFTPAAETRAAVETDFPDGSSFSVWGWYGTTGSTIAKTVFNNIPVTKSGEAWTYTGGTQYWIPDMTYNFYGVYPAYSQTSDNNGTTATVTPDGTITVTNFDCSATGENAVDLMTATHTRDYNGTNADAVNMPFQHELAKVEVSVRTDQGVTATIENAELTGMVYKGTLTATSNSSTWAPITSTSDETPYQVTEPVTINTPSTTSLFGDILIIPQKTDKLTLNITITRDKKENTYYFDLGTSIAQWTAGRSYRYVLTIEADAITFSNFTVDEWGETHTGGDINIGTSDN
ncbi:fimbrillin family protein [Mediterranea massiliensis]|uniref:Fimbrillin family protein n=1 Tax=Mediterranea massiliensis TaxID=1841865 RepID=A0ABS2DVW6_9BACT|nr:fimbrillin family protein [Mediterranea massiliensis]MBM6733635.1 fimbrillin family protein [Mediterranea massiliensis]